MSNMFLTNYTDTTFLEKIKDNLRHCRSFDFSVSFIKKAGLVLLSKDIEAAIERGVKGRLITSTYQNFTDIESLKWFFELQSRFSNFSCHLDYESFHDDSYMTLGYHSKGYLFGFENGRTELVVGSSNITRFALLKNIEWDVVVSDYESYSQAMLEFDDKWKQSCPLDTEIIEKYTTKLNFAIERWDIDYDLSSAGIKPNFMQRRALKELNRYRAVGANRALVVSAAGSGKTYLAAFDALNFNPKRLLYIVHEGSILRKSIETFEQVFGNSVSIGEYSGVSKDIDADFVFATNVSMAKTLELFDQKEFDYIIVDECHHATADTYKAIINYFQPEFLLGLTATPERMDNQDVFELFEKNVPYELRLRDAIINDLVVPFRYYGIRDSIVNYGYTKTEERKMVAQLSTSEHCEFISKQIEAYRPAGKLKALAFCSSISQAKMMSEELSGIYHTASLSGRNNVGERIRAYNDLQSDSSELEILFTVDILNEGVDIPGVNMVLFLRPTESSTIFIQQLGRGLRKYEGKQYVTVLDFIGNSYKRSVQIAFALSSLSKNFVLEKKLMASLVRDDFKKLDLEEKGVQIHIDDLSKEEILEWIEKENFNSLSYLKQDYFNFKKYIGAESYPKHVDYLNNDCAPDIMRFLNVKISGRKCYSYYNFLHGIIDNTPELYEDAKYLPEFAEEQVLFINYLSEMLPIVRQHEYLIFRDLLSGECSVQEIKHHLKSVIANFREEEFEHAINYINEAGFAVVQGDSLELKVCISTELKEYCEDLIEYGVIRFNAELGDTKGFKLWYSYETKEVQRLLLRAPAVYQRGTEYVDGNVLIFANLKKNLSDDDRLNYKDKFIQKNMFQWETVAGISNSELQKLFAANKVYLLIRKTDSEYGGTLPFIYVGTGKLSNPRKQEKLNPETGKEENTYLFDIPMDEELPDYLQYDFGVEN